MVDILCGSSSTPVGADSSLAANLRNDNPPNLRGIWWHTPHTTPWPSRIHVSALHCVVIFWLSLDLGTSKMDPTGLSPTSGRGISVKERGEGGINGINVGRGGGFGSNFGPTCANAPGLSPTARGSGYRDGNNTGVSTGNLAGGGSTT